MIDDLNAGILFLTTNQISQFDVAVQSRIHVAIAYKELNKTQTTNIFNSFLEQYEAANIVDSKEAKRIRKYVTRDLYQEHFDGRQIRNIVTSAVGLALSQEPAMLKEDHVKQVVSITKAFKKDLGYQMMQYVEQQRGAAAPT